MDQYAKHATIAGNNEDVTQQSPHARDRQDDNGMSPLDMVAHRQSMFASLANRLRGNPNGVGARQTGI